MKMAHFCGATTFKPSNRNDTRRRTMEVSATMLRDILIGYKDDDMENGVSLDETDAQEEMHNKNTEQIKHKNRARSEENSSKSKILKNAIKKQHLQSLNKNASKSMEESAMDIACVNHSNGFSTNPRQQSQDSVRFKVGHRYSPRQGSTGSAGSDASNKSQSEDSVGSEINTSNINNCEDLSERDINQHQSMLKTILYPPPTCNSSLNTVPPILTSSPLLHRRNSKSKTNLAAKKAPYYVGDTCHNSLNLSQRSNEMIMSAPPLSTHPHSPSYNAYLNSSSVEIPYDEVFSHLSSEVLSGSEMMSTEQLASIQAFSHQCCPQETPSSSDDNGLYDESMYRLLPTNPELSRACPNPMYQQDDGRTNMLSQLYYYNVEGVERNTNITNMEEIIDSDFQQTLSQTSHERSHNFPHILPDHNSISSQGTKRFSHIKSLPNEVIYNAGHSSAYFGTHPSFKDDKKAFCEQNIGNTDESGNAIMNGSVVSASDDDTSGKRSYDNFQERIRAYHPTQMQVNHYRGRNEEEVQQFIPVCYGQTGTCTCCVQYGNFPTICNFPDNNALMVQKNHSPSSLQYPIHHSAAVEDERRNAAFEEQNLDRKQRIISSAAQNNGGNKTEMIAKMNADERENIVPISLPENFSRYEEANCSCKDRLLYTEKIPYHDLSDNHHVSLSTKKKQMKSEDVTLWKFGNHGKDISDFNASDASSSMMSQHFELNRQINGNYLNDSFATSSSFSPYIPADSAAMSAKSSSLSKPMPNTAPTTKPRSKSFEETDDHATTVTVGDGIQSISFDCNNESEHNSMMSSGNYEVKNKHLPCVCAKVRDGDLVNDALDASTLASKQQKREWVRAYQHVACGSTSAKTKTLQSGFESGAEHFCYAPNIEKCDKNIGETHQNISNTKRDDKFSVNSQYCISADCECIENSSPCAVPFLQPRCTTKSTEGQSLQQEFPLAYNIVTPRNESYLSSINSDEKLREIRSQSLIQPLQLLSLGSEEPQQHLSLSAKPHENNSESERLRLYDLVNNHCDQLKRFFNLVPSENAGNPTEDEHKEPTSSSSNDFISNDRKPQDDDTKYPMVLNRDHQEWKEGQKDINMLGTKRGAVTKPAPGDLVKSHNDSLVSSNNLSSAVDSPSDSSLWSTNEKALKSLVKLKLDIPRINTSGSINSSNSNSSVNNSGNKSESSSKSPHLKNEMLSTQKRSLNQIQQQQYFHRCHGRRHGGQSVKSGQLLRATISHKVDIGTIRQQNGLQQKETIYTAWDNHHSPGSTTGESVAGNSIPYHLNSSYEGPSSLPSYHVNDIPRAPIPTPDDILRLNSNKFNRNKQSLHGKSKVDKRDRSEARKSIATEKQICTCPSVNKDVETFRKNIICPAHSSPVTFINSGASVNSRSGTDEDVVHKPRNGVSRGDTVRQANFRYESDDKHFYDSPTSSAESNTSQSHSSRPMTRQTTMDMPLSSCGLSSADVSFNVDSSFSSPNQSHYQTPKDRDGDYSYAYDNSVSPAFIIKYNEEIDREENGEDDEYDIEERTEKFEKRRGISSTKGAKNNDSNVENIYEEIRDVKYANKNSRSTSNDDDRSSRKSSSVNSDSGIGGFGNKPARSNKNKIRYSQGTLDIVNTKGRRDRKNKAENNKKENKDTGTKSISSSSNSGATSALDNLLFQTAPGMSPNQRRNLRKSLVDEVFEELVQRHHDRVLQQLRLDVEDFIAPNESDVLETPEKSISNNNSKASYRSSSTSSPMSRLKKCESMDFKDVASISSRSSSSFNTKNMQSEKDKSKKNSIKFSSKKQKPSADTNEGFKLSFLASAKRYGEAINRKYFAKSSRNKDTVSPSNDEQITDNKTSVKIRDKRRGKTKVRPLSALLLSSSLSKSSHIISENPDGSLGANTEDLFEFQKQNISNTDDVLSKHLSSEKQKQLSRSKSTGVSLERRNSDFDFDIADSDDELPTRKLQRSKIIASFLEQLNDNDNDVIDDDFGDNEENVVAEPTNNNNISASLISNNNNNNKLKSDQN